MRNDHVLAALEGLRWWKPTIRFTISSTKGSSGGQGKPRMLARSHERDQEWGERPTDVFILDRIDS